jgi:3-hydroxyisobutyrate dehydrogenase-like beta-hydroxyacid dehydrogenase
MAFEKIAVVGFGEAGPVFAAAFLNAGVPKVSAYDILIDDPRTAERLRAKTEALGVGAAETIGEAVADAEVIVSTVTADQTVVAAGAAAPHLRAGQTYFDLNSTSPKEKARAAALIEANGARFVEGAAMDTVPNFGAAVPILAAGETAQALAASLNALGMAIEVAGDALGAASSAKMLRSVLIKGFASLFAESMLAASRLGLEERVVKSLYVTFPGLDWTEVVSYYLGRYAVHAKRQAAEMRASAETVEDLGVEPMMTRATAERLQWAADLELARFYEAGDAPTIDDYIKAVAAASEAAKLKA